MQTKWNPSSAKASLLWNPECHPLKKPHAFMSPHRENFKSLKLQFAHFFSIYFFFKSWLYLMRHHGLAFAIEPLKVRNYHVLILFYFYFIIFFFLLACLGQHGSKWWPPTVSFCIIDFIQVSSSLHLWLRPSTCSSRKFMVASKRFLYLQSTFEDRWCVLALFHECRRTHKAVSPHLCFINPVV